MTTLFHLLRPRQLWTPQNLYRTSLCSVIGLPATHFAFQDTNNADAATLGSLSSHLENDKSNKYRFKVLSSRLQLASSNVEIFSTARTKGGI